MSTRTMATRIRPALLCAAVLCLATRATAATTGTSAEATTEPRSAIAVQGGWWSLEGEWRTRIGVYVDIGIPWVAVPLALGNGASWAAPLGARLGYQLPLSPRWSLRASAHGAFMLANEDAKCGCASDGDVTNRSFVFAEVGLRYEAPSGFVAGADLPVFGMRLPHHLFPPPQSLAFTQAYVGYSWGR